MEEILVLGLTAYRFADERTGEMREGAHVHYVNDYTFNEPDKKGFLVVKISVPMSVFAGNVNQSFPAICTMKTINLPDGKGKPKPTVTEINYIRPVEIFSKTTVAAAK